MILLSAKLRLYNAYILPVFLYGAETWSITKAIENELMPFTSGVLAHPEHYLVGECDKLRSP